MYCLNCGTKLSGSPKFCHHCGQPVAAEEVVAPATTSVKRARGRGRRVLLGCAGLLFLTLFLCSTAATALYFWLDFDETNQTATLVRAEETVAFASFSPSLLQLVHIRRLQERPQSIAVLAPVAVLPGVAEAGEMAQEYLPLDLQVDPVTDILPWIGREISVAVLEEQPLASERFERSARLATQAAGTYAGPPLVLSVTTRNPNRTATFLAKVRSQMEEDGVVFANSVYRDILITEVDAPAELPLAYATFNEMLVLTTDTATLHRAIDTAFDDNASVLREAPTFRETSAGLPSNRLGFAYMDAQTLVKELDVPPALWQVYAAQHIGLSVALQRNGVRLDYLVDMHTAGLDGAQEAWLRLPATENNFIEQVPANCLFYFSGQNLLLFLESLVGEELRASVRELEDEEGLAVWDGLIELSRGEYAVALMEDRHGLLGDELPLSALLLADVEDHRQVENMLHDLGSRVAELEGTSFYEDEINRTEVWMLEDESAGDIVGYGVSDNTVFIGTSYNALRSATQFPQSSLASSSRFRAAAAPLPGQFREYLYLDVQQLTRLAERGSLDNLDDDEVWRYVGTIDTISLTMAPLDTNDRLHGVLFVVTRN